MAKHKRCVVKRRRKEEGKRRKREEKEEKIVDQIAKKRKKSVRILFLCAVVIFLSIRNTLFREKHTISAFVTMQDFFINKLCDF